MGARERSSRSTRSSRARRPAAAPSRSSSARTTARGARRCSSATCRPARRRGTTTSTTRSSGSGAAPAATTSATRSSRSRTAPPSGSRRARCTSSRTRTRTASSRCSASSRPAGSPSAAYLTPDDRRDLRVRVGMSADSATAAVGAAIRGEFPIFEHTTYLNSCSQGALSHRVRAAYEEYLAGWDENGAEWEFWVERAEAARAGFAELLHGDADEVAVTTSVSQGVSGIVSALPFERGGRNRIVISEYEFPTVGQIAHAQELRGAEVVHVRPDAGRLDPGRAVRRGDRRAHGARLLHDDLVPHGPPPRRRRDRRGRPRERSARARRQLPGGGRDRARRAHARRRLRHGRHGQVPARLRRPRLPLGAARGARRPDADADRLVRRRGHLPDGHLRLLAARDRPPLRCGHAAGAEHLRGRRRPRRSSRRRACPRSRRTCAGAQHAADRRARGARRRRRHARRSGPPRPARLRPLDRRPRARRLARRGEHRLLAPRHEPPRRARTSTTPTRTSTRCSTPSRAAGSCSPDRGGAEPQAAARAARSPTATTPTRSATCTCPPATAALGRRSS